ncbi:aminoglycoside phosphotransferase (APT) family kinase protein [Novosphingobium hassiacum]|uniref:Aminoglycoside phosphotransferase (APT) family kinase protein n=1 Tax=Novosphingobium hassiacum TaxID=173676 RepID=A0A7W5ZY49_9SPHN|nr:phosphotransferase family protein [Novosphingobium hassiacum]MBB3862165.1 aminoglycoside phosphotransferase (APT) family kinase protein [Novosphingobium hassiacum]
MAAQTELSINLAGIERWLVDNGILQGSGLNSLQQLAGGTQNIVLRFSNNGRDYVLRHPPAKPRPNSNKLLEREIRLLRALAGSAVPHPAVVGACLDQNVIGGVFYVMEAIDGFNPTVAMGTVAAASPDVRHRMGLDMVDGLVALANVDPIASGLADFGKLEGFLERQVIRWASELESYARFEGWSGPQALGDVGAVGQWLTDNLPPDMQPGIIHGDYHIGNCIFAEDGALNAIVDWEMATLGDPLVDLGRLLVSWPVGGEVKPQTMRVEPIDGFATRAELIARYAKGSGRDMRHLPWFEVLACYKLGLILEGTHARSQAGLADVATGERLHRSAIALLDEARAIIARG